MSRHLLFIALAACMLDARATATPQPPATPPTTINAGASSESAAAAAAKAAANSSATSGSVSGAAASSDQAQSFTGGDSSSRYYVLPAPGFTPPMAPVTCPTPTIENRHFSIWGITFARGDTKTDVCAKLTVLKMLWDTCKYAKQDRAENVLLEEVFGGSFNEPRQGKVLYDLHPEDCLAAQRLAAFGPPPAPVTNYYQSFTTPPLAESVKPLACEQKAPPKRRAVAKKPAAVCAK